MKQIRTSSRYPHFGFTLIETVISIGVVATLLVTFLAIFGLATDTLHETINSREADRLVSALERELAILREDELDDDTKTAFDKAYEWIDKSSQGSDAKILLYTYEGDPSAVRDDGSLVPLAAGVGDLGSRLATSSVKFVEGGGLTDEMRAELEATSSPVFYVKTTQLVYEDGKLVPGEPGIVPPHDGQAPLDGGVTPADAYPEAVIAYSAAFYLLPTNSPEYVGSFSAEDLRRPLFTRSLAVRR